MSSAAIFVWRLRVKVDQGCIAQLVAHLIEELGLLGLKPGLATYFRGN